MSNQVTPQELNNFFAIVTQTLELQRMVERNGFIRSQKFVAFPNSLLSRLSGRLQAEIVDDLEGLLS